MIKIAVVALIILGLLSLGGYYLFSIQTAKVEEKSNEGYERLSDDPAYREVVDKYNLTEEQLQILSTVNPGDN